MSLVLRPEILKQEIKVFFVKYNDPIYVKLEKLDIMIRLASQANIAQVLTVKTPKLNYIRVILLYSGILPLCVWGGGGGGTYSGAALIEWHSTLKIEFYRYSHVPVRWGDGLICVTQVLAELKEYATEVDVDFVRKAVRAIGRCAIKVEVKKQNKKKNHILNPMLCQYVCFSFLWLTLSSSFSNQLSAVSAPCWT